MPPEVSAIRSASPEKMEELPSAEEAGLKGKGRKNSVAFKNPREKAKSAEEPEKERQMIGRADQVYIILNPVSHKVC